MRAAEITQHVLFRVAPFLMSDNDATLRAECGQTTRHGSIIRKSAIAMQLHPICKTAFNVIQSERPLHMPCDLDALPCRQVAINLAARFAKLCFQLFDGRIKIDIVLVGVILQVLQSPFQFKDRFFKIKRLPFHGRLNFLPQSIMVTAVLLFTRLLSSSTSEAARPRPTGGGGCSRLGCAASGTEYRV